jgi:transposase InsO family protein
VTDGGTQFTSWLVRDLMENYKIKHKVTTPYHPQENGQVEGTNKILEAIITKTVRLHLKDWAMIDSLKLYGPTKQPGELLQDAHLMS